MILQSRRCIPRPARCASGAAPDADGVCADTGAPLLPNEVCGDYEAECDREIDELEAAGLMPAGGDAAGDYAAGDYEAGDSADYDYDAGAPTCTDAASDDGCADYFYCDRGVCKELSGAAGAAAATASAKTKPSSAPSPPAAAPAPASSPPSAGSTARAAGAGVGAALGAAALLW